MILNKLLYSFLIVLPLIGYCQRKVKIGDKAPKITITNYINNVPKDTVFEGKFIVLDFWATWCGSCLEEVPKLNALKSIYQSNTNLLFVSITDEKTEKVLRIIKKIPFNSILVSDQNKNTQKEFIMNSDGSFFLPQTVLIDDKGIVKWIGTIKELDENTIENFLNKKEILKSEKTNEIDSPIMKTNSDENDTKITNAVLKTITNKNTKFSFNILTGDKNEFKGNIDDLKINGLYFDLNTDLISILSHLTNVPKNLILINNTSVLDCYSIFYKNLDCKNIEQEKESLKNELLKKLKLSEKLITKKVETYSLKIEDINKLEVSNDNETQILKNKTHFIFFAITIKSLIKELSDSFNLFMSNDSKTLEKYNFIIRNNSIENVISDLKSYGLKFEKKYDSIKFTIYE